MNYYQVIIFSFSVLLGTIIGWVRFKKIEPACLPFLLCLTVASFNELLSFIMTYNRLSTTINNNIYVLLEALLLTWQFRRWGLFDRYHKVYYSLLSIICGAWIIGTLIVHNMMVVSTYFRLFYSFMIVLMSITINNQLILTYRNSLLKSPVFLICSGFIIYFTYKILVEAFWLYGLNAGRQFRINVYLLLTWINLFVNIIYAVAILWIPKKPQHITLF